MIRLEGAEVLCDSIRANRTLTHLDLSYNALGRSAAQVLGAALMHNNVRPRTTCHVQTVKSPSGPYPSQVIREINVAQNGIDAVGCFALCVGARENLSLHFLNLDGNPLGELV
jgi:Ran GTPase-activating protein (RanGAP) involved in mRNA processing and transport